MIWALIAIVLLCISTVTFAVLWFRMGEDWYDEKCRADALQIELDLR